MPGSNLPSASKRRRLAAAVLLSTLALSAGCNVGPNYKSPAADVPDAWSSASGAASADNETVQWWTVFQDPTLTSLVDRAYATNLDVKVAESRIRQARASRGIAAAGLGPTLDVSGSATRGRASSAKNAPRAPEINRFQAGFDAGWEIDIFGGVRRGVEAADSDIASAVESRRDVLVTLAGEVAVDYVDLRTLQQRIAIARRNLEIQKHSAGLTRQRFDAGLASKLDVVNADALVATTASQIPLLESSSRQTIYALSVLLDREPNALMEELSETKDIPSAPPEVPTGVPSDLLRRRPDIRRAEAAAHAATARIGVATADLYPRFTLNGSLGWSAGNLGSLFNSHSLGWSFGPSLSWPIFDAGRIQSNIELQKAFTEESVIAYEQTVLNALLEVETALIASTKEQEHRKALADAVTANRQAVDLATKLYTEGQTDFLSVLDAQRSLYGSEDAFTQSTGTVSTNLIALYKSLGGGWQESGEEPQKTP